MNVFHLIQLIYWSCVAATCAIAWTRGAHLERMGAGVVALGSFAALISTAITPADYASAQVDILLIDLTMLGGFLFILINSDRFWPIWASGSHLVGVATHLAKLSFPDILPQVYWTVQGMWTFPVMLAIVAGSRRRTGPAPNARA